MASGMTNEQVTLLRLNDSNSLQVTCSIRDVRHEWVHMDHEQ
jgi:hypothetical protein